MQKIRLQCVAKGTRGIYKIFVGDVEHAVEIVRVFSDPAKLLKKRTIEVLLKGILDVKPLLKHDDLLVIELENQNLINWLRESKEYPGYEKLSAIYNELETLNCQIEFVCRELPDCHRLLKVSQEKTSTKLSFDDLMKVIADGD